MESLKQNFRKYRWFITSLGKIVIGGKSASQNDELLKQIKKSEEELIVMHTSSPGSPFSVILSDTESIKEREIEESAIFTACFSKAWKSGKLTSFVDVFQSSQLYKDNKMKQGTWGVKGKVKRLSVPLSLVLTKQKGVLRAVPKETIKIQPLLIIHPGKIDKRNILPKLEVEFGNKFSQEEILSALPSGGLKIINTKEH